MKMEIHILLLCSVGYSKCPNELHSVHSHSAILKAKLMTNCNGATKHLATIRAKKNRNKKREREKETKEMNYGIDSVSK